MFDSYPDVLTIPQLANALNIGTNKAYQLITDNELRFIRIGKSIRIPKCWLIEYITNGQTANSYTN